MRASKEKETMIETCFPARGNENTLTTISKNSSECERPAVFPDTSHDAAEFLL